MNHADSRDRLQLVVSLARAGELDEAARVASSLLDKDKAAAAWHHIARTNADLQRLGAARSAIEQACRLRPESADLRLERALILESDGALEDALAELKSLVAQGHATPMLAAHLARSLEFAGHAQEAQSTVEAALVRWPTDAGLHSLLVELRWSRGAGAALTARVEEAIGRFPQELQLRLVAANALRNAGFEARALELLQEGLKRAPDSSAFLTSIGILLDSLGRFEEALGYLQAATRQAPTSKAARQNLVPTLLRLSRSAEALRLCDELSSQFPDDQQLIAWRATALRAMDHPEYERLHDYARLVRSYRLRCDEPGGIEAFNAVLARELTALHRGERRPLAQSLRGGSQTDRNLPLANPVIARFFAMLEDPIRDYIASLSALDPAHPTRRRAGAATDHRISGSWSVQLKPGGFHVNHVHPAGWLSSAYYVELPPQEPDSRAGWLAFGEPGISLPGMPADHFVRPETGMLVLFPSYVWHGTVPFTGGSRRLTAAFDVLPR